jgi:hypothetical protein
VADFVEYCIYLPSNELPSDATEEATVVLLAWQMRILDLVRTKVESYAWYRETFQLVPVIRHHEHNKNDNRRKSSDGVGGSLRKQEPTTLELPHLHGSTAFGEAIDDEWMVVHLLLEISAHWPELAVRVYDADGEFLLIEGAEFLPRWCSPATCEGRVWLRAGHVHLIRPPRTPAELARQPAAGPLRSACALSLLSEPDTRAPAQLEQAVMARARAASQQTPHMAIARVPARLARLLATEPFLLSLAAEALAVHDPEDVRSLSAGPRLFSAGEELLYVRLRFSRLQYAQILWERVRVPPAFRLPRSTTATAAGRSEAEKREERACVLGERLLCGLEMAHAAALRRSRSGRAARQAAEPTREQLQEALDADPLWQRCRTLLGASAHWDSLQTRRDFLLAARPEAFSADPLAAAFARLLDLAAQVSARQQPESRMAPSSAATQVGSAPGGGEQARAEGTMLARRLEELPPDSDESWLHLRLDRDRAWSSAPEPELVVASRLRSFLLEAASGLEGVEPPRPASAAAVPASETAAPPSLDSRAFFSVLDRHLGLSDPGLPTEPGLQQRLHEMQEEEGEEDEEDEEEEGMEEEEAEGWQEAGEEAAATKAFFEQLQRQMEAELHSSLEGGLYPTAPPPHPSPAAPASSSSSSSSAAPGTLTTVQLDENLVASILASVTAQHGAPGPLTNLLSQLQPHSS